MKTITQFTLFALFLSLRASTLHAAEPSCVIIDNVGVEETDAESVRHIVCEALERQGVPSDGLTYEIAVRRLGSLVWLSVDQVRGQHLEWSGELGLEAIEEVAARRIAAAVADDRPVEESGTVTTLVGEETRPYDKLPGEFLYGVGLLALGVPGADTGVVPGLGMTAFYEAAHFATGATMGFGIGGSGGTDTTYIVVGIDGRWLPLDGNISPFVGGGFDWMTIEVAGDASGDDVDLQGSGLGAHAEAGVEFLRLHGSRLMASVRADFPLYDFETTRWDADTWTYEEVGTGYYVPLSFGLRYVW